MANYSTLKSALDAVIKTNIHRMITGDVLNSQLDGMIDALGAGYQYMGMATTSTNPGTPDARVVWLASTPGTYTYFGNQVLTEGKIAFFRWDGSWHKDEVEVQPVLTMDDTPTEESDNPVKSGGIYDALETKQDTVADLSDIRSGAAAGATAYQKPETGIPKTDLASAVQSSLEKADSAVQDISGKQDVLTFDDVPTSGSDNPVKSGGIYEAINARTSSNFKGFYNNSAALSTAWPNPSTGDYAYVKNSGTPATANVYGVSSGSWYDTGISMDITDMDTVFPLSAKEMLISTLEKVAWIDGHGQEYLNELRTALMGTVSVDSIEATFTPGTALIFDTNSLDDLKQYLEVIANYSDGSSDEVLGYTLTGSLNAGTNTITVTYMGKTDTFTVTAIHNYAGLLSTWTLHPNVSVASYSEGTIQMKCLTANDYNNYNVWVADIKNTLWNTVNGKTLKVRVKVNDIDLFAAGVGIYQNAQSTSLATASALRVTLTSSWTIATDGYYEANFVCDVNNFTAGTLVPTSASTFGIFGYCRTQSEYAEIYDAQVYEIQNG